MSQTVTKKLMLFFPKCECEKPIIYHLVKDYDLIVNVFRAKVTPNEETGKLDEMLMKVSDTYDIEVRNTIDRLLSVFTPVVTLLLAVLIGTIVLSVLVAILSINDLVG